MMMTMTTLAEDVSNSSRQTSSRTVKKCRVTDSGGFFPVESAKERVTPPRQCRRSLRDAALSATSRVRRTHNLKGTQRDVHRHQENQPCTQREVHRHQQKPALHIPLPLPTTSSATSTSAMFEGSMDGQSVRAIHAPLI